MPGDCPKSVRPQSHSTEGQTPPGPYANTIRPLPSKSCTWNVMSDVFVKLITTGDETYHGSGMNSWTFDHSKTNFRFGAVPDVHFRASPWRTSIRSSQSGAQIPSTAGGA